MVDFFSFFNKREEAGPSACSDEQPPKKAASYGSHVVTVSSPTAALAVSAWYRASEVLANTMSQLQMEYQKKNDQGHGGNWEIDLETRDGSAINYLLQVRPNSTMDATQLWKQMALQRFFQGNAVVYIERNKMDNVEALWLCQSAALSQTKDGMKYAITYQTTSGVVTKTVDDTDVIHWRNTFSNDLGLTGVGTLRYAAQALSVAATNDRQAKENAGKGGKHKLLIKEDTSNVQAGLKKLNANQKTRQKDELQEAINNNDDVLLLSGMMDATVISQDAQQMQLLDNRKFDTQQVSRFSGVPPVMLMDYSNNTYKAPEQANQEFLVHTIAPMAKSLETEMNAKLLTPGVWTKLRYHFTEASLMRLDPLGRANLGKIELETGVKCVNELRAERDLPAIDKGDRHFISTNLQPVDSPTVGAASVAPNTARAKKKGDAV